MQAKPHDSYYNSDYRKPNKVTYIYPSQPRRSRADRIINGIIVFMIVTGFATAGYWIEKVLP